MKKIVKFFYAALLLIPVVVLAQNENGQMRQRHERFEELRMIKLMEALQLDEETSVRFVKRYHQHQDEMKSLLKERGLKIDQLEEAIKNQKDDDCEQLLNEVLALEKKASDKRIDFIKSLSSILTKQQQARFVIFDRNFDRDLRDMVQQQQKSWR